MQPKTNVKMDKESFNRIRKTVREISVSNKKSAFDKSYRTKLPKEIGLQLTNKCNLRCKHCFEWSSQGYNHDMSKQMKNSELSIDLIENLLEETKSVNSNLFLWGGEPLVYEEWDKLAQLVYDYKRWSVICTNGIGVIKQMESLLKMSEFSALLTSVEGFEKENDDIRGKGSYKKAMDGIHEVQRLIKLGEFKGKQSIHCTISNENVHTLYDFATYCEEINIDTLYICFPWYIPVEVAQKMDKYYEKHFGNIGNATSNNKRSWYSFDFHLEDELIHTLYEQMEKINQKSWNIRIRFQPAVELNEVHNFARGIELAAQKKKKCLAVTSRMDVLSDGTVSACKLFREFDVGNLYNHSIDEIWNGERFNKIRSVIAEGLTPVCSKCILLYLNGI